LDASALVKRYVAEPGSEIIASALMNAEVVGTSVISRVETVAALAKAIRVGALTQGEAKAAADSFRTDWPYFVRVKVTEILVARADTLSWEIGLRGYDAVQLASVLLWREGMEQEIVMATFDQKLWQASRKLGLSLVPDVFPG
jgi:predicted nucleic acid-binding protein